MDDSQQWPAMVALLKPRRRSLHATITPAFGLSFLLFLLVSSLAYKSTSRLIADGQKVASAQEVLTRLATAGGFLERAETENRGYVLSASPQQLERMNASLEQTATVAGSIAEPIADSPGQAQTLAQLTPLISAEIDRLQRVAAIRTSGGFDAASAATTDPSAAAAIMRIRDLFEQMRAEECFLLRDRTARAANDAGSRAWSFGCMGIAVFLGLALSYALVLEFEKHVKHGEQELQDAKKAAETASQFKSTYLASMSHEIRTPMTAIMGFADLLIRPSLTDANRLEYVDTIRRNGAHLLNVLNDILDLSKIEAGKMEVERIACSPVQIVEDVVELLQRNAAERGTTLQADYVGRCPETILTDPTRLRQVLTNLVSNALKFTERGSVRLEVQLVNAADGKSRLQFRVTDTGIGMTAEQMNGLFEPFKQADATSARRFGGTGLGLTISRQFAQLLGGDIFVSSESGHGSTFSAEVATGPLEGVRLLDRPRESFQRAAEAAAHVAPRLEGKILVAEDSPTNQQLICLHLREAGATVEVAENGRAACDLVIAAARTKAPFHLVLMDMEMPELDGCAATLQLRNAGQKLPIIALTANAMAADRDHCMSAGCNAFVTKPIDWPRLMDMLRGYLQNKATGKPGARDPHLARVMQIFMAELDQTTIALRTAITSGERNTLAHLAHGLKGTAGNCGFSELAACSGELESLAKDTVPSETVTRAAERLLDLCVRSRTPRAA